MKKTIAIVDGKAVYSYKSDKCICGCDCDHAKVLTDKTTGNKYTIAVDNGELIVEPYAEPTPGGANNLVGSAVVGTAHAG